MQPSSNVAAQKQLFENLQKNKADSYGYNHLLQTASSSELRSQITSKINNLEETIIINEKRLKRLKGNAEAQQ